jgi:hypothetical protein
MVTYRIKGSQWYRWSYHFKIFAVASMTRLTNTKFLCQKWPWICSVCHHNLSFPYSCLITDFVTRRIPLVEKELLSLLLLLSLPLVFDGRFVSFNLWFSVFCVMFCTSLFVLLSFIFWPLSCLYFIVLSVLLLYCLYFYCRLSFGHCIVCTSWNYSFWIPLLVFSNFFCVLCLVYPMLPVFLGCPFLIAPSVFFNVYLLAT